MNENRQPKHGRPATRTGAFFRLVTEDRRRLVLSIVAGEALALSALHHLWNLWGLTWDKQALAILVVGPALAPLVSIALTPIWDKCKAIRKTRWLQFVVPAALLAAVLTSRLFAVPEVGHELTIVPREGTPPGEIRIREIRAAYGNTVPLLGFSNSGGWSMQSGLLLAATPTASPIRYSFRGPIGELIRISFITSPKGGGVSVDLDGRRLDLDLLGAEGNETRARLYTTYPWGLPNSLMFPLLAVIDMLASLFLLAAVWLAHELGQRRRLADSDPQMESWTSHRVGLLIVCSLGLALHAVNFMAVPLRVPKDGPSYLDGAVHWATYHNLDGASSYRGPGTTFLFAPAMAAFGRNPLGVKLVLHALALACIPLAYRIGWQLQRRRWVAIAAGVVTALSPDLYAYSNFVLSEVPDIFMLLAFCTTLISAMESLSPGWMMAALLVGSMAVLVRADNIAALGLGMVSLIAAVWSAGASWAHWDRKSAGFSSPVGSLIVGLLLAALPLVAWSLHNARVHGFFGISNYGGAVLYDGWIYYGEGSGIRILDRDSRAVQQIDEVIPIIGRRGSDAPTSWTVLDALWRNGYGNTEAFSVLGQAAIDSIRRHIPQALELLVLKLQQAPRAQPNTPPSILLVGPPGGYADLTWKYFDDEVEQVPALGRLQDRINDAVYSWYAPIYSIWFVCCLLMLWLGAYRRPPRTWLPIAAITLNALLFPTVAGLASWRYLIPGIILAAPLSLSGLDTLRAFGLHYFRQARGHVMPL